MNLNPFKPTPVPFELLETEPMKIELTEHVEVEPTPRPVKFELCEIEPD